RVHAQRFTDREPQNARSDESHRSRRSRHPRRPAAAHQEWLERARRTEDRPRRQMAAQSLRSQRNARRTDGIQTDQGAVLFALHRSSSRSGAMICPCSVSRYRWLRNLCSLVCAVIGCCSLPLARGQSLDLEKPLLNIDEDISAFAFAPDGRVVYSVRRQFHTKQYDLERDDIWLQENGGKRRRLLQGEKFLRGNTPFTYTIDSFRWSPNGRLILAQLFTTSVVDEHGGTQDSIMTLALEDNGKEIHLGANDSLLKDAYDAIWLVDNATIVYLTEIVKPRVLFSFKYINIAAGPSGDVFEGRTFLDAYPIPRANVAIGVERDRNLTGPPRLQRLELLAQDDRELATLDTYEGGLSVSPSAKKAAYFIDKEVLEVRDLTDPTKSARLRTGF